MVEVFGRKVLHSDFWLWGQVWAQVGSKGNTFPPGNETRKRHFHVTRRINTEIQSWDFAGILGLASIFWILTLVGSKPRAGGGHLARRKWENLLENEAPPETQLGDGKKWLHDNTSELLIQMYPWTFRLFRSVESYFAWYTLSSISLSWVFFKQKNLVEDTQSMFLIASGCKYNVSL